ncbi:hypothetical protein [Streptomyces sp. NPDC053542]|uniref:hypothetical protein n=1 Tax=Streptomyces sp. NPDC053542 TaxID=3365710 RepID=UPI0037D97EA6
MEAVRRNDATAARRHLERLLREARTSPASCSATVARAMYVLAGLDAAEGLLLTARSGYAASAEALEGARCRAERDGDRELSALLMEFRDYARTVAADLAENCGIDVRSLPGPRRRALPPGEPAGVAGRPNGATAEGRK